MSDEWHAIARAAGLLIDTNLLVLFVVGSINRSRVPVFKRTSKYSGEDYDLLLRVIGAWRKPLFTLPHVLAEVSNLTDLKGHELLSARHFLKGTIAILREPELASARAAQNAQYGDLGLVDAAIATLAREHDCAVLTDDLTLYLALHQEGVPSLNFAHLQASNWGL